MSKAESPSKNRKIKIGGRLGGLLLAAMVLVLLVIFGIFYLQKISEREKLAGYLPADRTVAFLEYNLEPGRQDASRLTSLLLQNNWLKQLNDGMQSFIPYPDQFQKWYSGRGGLTILSSPNQQDFRTALFLGVADNDRVTDWIDSLLLDKTSDAVLDEDYYGQKLISFRKGQYMNILWTKDYLVFSDDKEVLESIAGALTGKTLSLHTLPSYNQLSSALPEENLGFIYLDRNKLLSVLSRNETFLAGRLQLFKLYFPFLSLISTEAIAFQLDNPAAEHPTLTAKHLALFDPSQLPDKSLFETEYFYHGDLEKLLPPGNLLLAGGANLLDQKNKLQSYLTAASPLNNLIFQGALNSVRDLAGNSTGNFDLDSDFFPLFQKDYLFFLDVAAAGKYNFGLLVQSDQPANDLLKMEKFILAVGPQLASRILAKPVAVTLPDGTTGSEIKASLNAPTISRTETAGLPIEQIEFAPDFSLYLVADQDKKLLLVTNSPGTIQDILQQAPNAAQTAQDYGLDKPTEAYFLDTGKLPALLPAAAALKPLQYIKAARKFTEIGILSTYQFGL